MLPLEIKQFGGILLPHLDLWGGGSVSRGNTPQHDLQQQEGLQTEPTKVMRISRPTISSTDYERSKRTRICGVLQLFCSMITNNVKLNPLLSWQKQHSARRRLFSQGNWT